MRNFSEAIIDYANGCPNAQIILVNYGEIPKKYMRISHQIFAQG